MSISSSLLVTNYSDDRKNARLLWDEDFKNNYRMFAQDIAFCFAKYVVKEFQNSLKNPYHHSYNGEHPFTENLPLNITKNDVAKWLKENIRYEISPFDQWIETFLSENTSRTRLDRQYFHNLMDTVGRVAELTLNEIFRKYQAVSEKQNLEFKVFWYRRGEDEPKRYDIVNHSLNISLWFK